MYYKFIITNIFESSDNQAQSFIKLGGKNDA